MRGLFPCRAQRLDSGYMRKILHALFTGFEKFRKDLAFPYAGFGL
jgi:hypothetical protein